jgi:hypothetical protein
VQSSSPLVDLKTFAVRGENRITTMIVNYDPEASQDRIVKIHFSGLNPGTRSLTAYRIDDNQLWSEETLELIPVDERRVDVLPDFEYQFFSPGDSVLLVTLEEIPSPIRMHPTGII